MRAPSRALTTFAVGFLVLDAVLLVYLGMALARPWFTVSGAACALAAGLVVLGWRWYRRAMLEIDAARRAMRAEVESIRELLREHHLQN